MKVISIFYSMLFCATLCSAMEIEQKETALPLDILKIISNKRCTTVTTNRIPTLLNCETLCFPWTIPPIFLKSCFKNTPLDEDLRIFKPEDTVFPNIQFWDKTIMGGDTVRISEDISRTDHIYTLADVGSYTNIFFDGLNTLRKGLSAYKSDSYKPGAHYALYLWEQPKDFNQTMETKGYRTFYKGSGTLESMMLDPDENKIMCSVHRGENKEHELWIKEIVQSYAGPYNLYEVAYCLTNILFEKTVSLGNNTYMGISKEGNLYTIALNKNNTLTLFQQKFSSCPHVFKHISVDRSVKTENGFKPKVALLTDKGKLYVTNLCETEKPTLFYVMTIESADDVWRLYYHESKLSIIYRKTSNAVIYPDNFEFLFLAYLLKMYGGEGK
jgi:hypothetical protein